MEVKCCPGCKNTNYRLVGKVGNPIYHAVGSTQFYQPEYRIKTCLHCGLYYKSNIAEESELNEYYQKVDFQKWKPKKIFPNEAFILNTLFKLPAGSRILDYGCSTGRLLYSLTNQHYCFGIEINTEAIAIAKQKGIKIILEEEVYSKNITKFDAIVLSDVFEHLINPTEILEKLSQCLKPEGLLIICTGNADAKACQNDLANFWYFTNIEHICMLSEKYANFIAKKLQLNLKNWCKLSHYNESLWMKIFQHLRNFSYWQFHGDSKFSLKHLLKLIPFLRRAEQWTQPPYFSCSKDHVVAIFQK